MSLPLMNYSSRTGRCLLKEETMLVRRWTYHLPVHRVDFVAKVFVEQNDDGDDLIVTWNNPFPTFLFEPDHQGTKEAKTGAKDWTDFINQLAYT
ncbi:hypothetical protein V6N11_075463 [Hibiscus sabdariffa]|uniref:Uncharacterized protein n=1 Tax=Hibiscus sabdariffa TaxID=183260 RepID=A0ABR2R6Z9_9ROSI